MKDITSFFAEPRKAKNDEPEIINQKPESNQDSEVKKADLKESDLKEQQKSLKADLNKNAQETSVVQQVKKERYKAKPKERKVYFEKRSDLYSFKRIQVNDEDYRFLSDFEKGLSIARRHLNAEDRVNYRITSNTLIRLALENFVTKAKISVNNNDNIFNELQSEESIMEWIESL